MNETSIPPVTQTTPSQKPFFKQWWLWAAIVIILIGGFAFAWKTGHNQDKNKTPDKNFKRNDSTSSMVMSSDIPLCPADTSTIFTKPFMDGNKPDFIIPLGSSGMSSHVVPVDHVYPSDNIKGEVGPVYAPGRITLVWIENKQIFYKDTNEKVAPDYQLNFAPCRGINFALIHLTKLSDKLAEAITEPVDSRCGNQQMDYGKRFGREIYYKTCHPLFKKVTLEAGEYIGDFGFVGNTNPLSGFDIGLYDFNKPMVGFVNPQRVYAETNRTACFADYYIPELRAKYYAKFGEMTIENGQAVGNFRPVDGEPKCGKVMWDMVGTASGDWFKNKIQSDYVTDNEAAVFIHDNIRTKLGKFTIAGVTSFNFSPLHSGTINREFSEVTADGKIYCYQREEFLNEMAPVGKDGRPVSQDYVKKYLFQLVDDTHIKIEEKQGVCGKDETMVVPVVYER